MSSNLLQAAETIKRELNRMRGLQIAAEAIERIGSFEQAEEDARRKHVEITGKVNEATARLLALDTEYKARIVDLNSHVEQARREADRTKTESLDEAKKVIDNAKAQGADLVAKANTRAKEIVDAAQVQASQAMARKKDIDALTDQVRVQRDEAQHELAALQDKIDKAKAEVKRILG